MNKVILMGRLTKDPDIRYSGKTTTPVATFTLAVNRRFSKEQQADFFQIVVWDKQAEFCSQYFTKGMQVGVIGRLQTRTWDDVEGKRHYVTEVIAEEAYFADSKRDQHGNAQGDAFEEDSDYRPMDEDLIPPWRK